MFLSKRNGVYHIFYTDEKGKRHSVSTKCKLKSEANKFLVKLSNELKEQKECGKTFFDSITLERFCLEYLKYSDTVHTYWTNFGYKRTFGFFKGFFPDMYLEDFTPADISRYIEFRIRSSSKYQARKDLINLAAAFNWALLKGMIKVNPCKDIKKVKVPQKLPLFYSEEDFKKLMDVIDSEDIRDIVQFAVNTGLRQMELIKLEWYMVNFDKRIVILDNRNHLTKGKKVRTIPLNSKAFEVLQKRHAIKSSEKIFTYGEKEMTQNFLSHKFADYVDKAKINSKLNFHSLRHTFASWLVQKGVSIYEVSKLLGHSDIKTTQIYAHLRGEDLKRAVDLL